MHFRMMCFITFSVLLAVSPSYSAEQKVHAGNEAGAKSKTIAVQARYIDGYSTRVVDGDTIKFTAKSKKDLEKTTSIRMLNIDTPETHFPAKGGWVDQGYHGEAATKLLEYLLPPNAEVTLLHLGLDKYKRILGRVFKDGYDINLTMVRMGWAIPYFICDEDRCVDENFFGENQVEQFIIACNEARQDGVGIFDPQNPLLEMPFEFRARISGRGYSRYVGDFYSGKLYEPNDYKKVDVCSRIFFDNINLATNLNFKL